MKHFTRGKQVFATSLFAVVRDDVGFAGNLAGWRAIFLMRGSSQAIKSDIRKRSHIGDITYCQLNGVW
jgi:hypothetical protein